MLEASWEAHASTLANAATTHDLIEAIETVIRSARIDLSKPARVVYGRDTRPSGPALVAALRDGLTAIGAEIRDAGVVTTPILHYLVRAINTKGTKDAYGDDSEDGYYGKLSGAFKKLVVSHCLSVIISTEQINCVGRKTNAPTIDCRLCQRRWCRCHQQYLTPSGR
jgi:phosphoacetylglucosamine mutase